MKRYSIIFIVFMILIIPYKKAFAEDFPKIPMTLQSSSSVNLAQRAIDGNFSTAANFSGGGTITLKLSAPSDIKSLKYSSNDYGDFYFYDSEGTLLQTVNFPSSGAIAKSINALDIRKVDTMKVKLFRSQDFMEIEVYGETPKVVIHEEVNNVVSSSTDTEINISWDNPLNNQDFTGIQIWRDDLPMGTFSDSTKEFKESNLKADTLYRYRISAVYSDGFVTPGIIKQIQTQPPPPPDRDNDGIPDSEDEFPDDPTNTPPPPEPIGEVKNLEIQATHKSANLSWVLPQTDKLQHVNIYRDTLTEETSFMDKLINVKKAYAASEKIFETNGTYFNDYTVKPGTEYEYTVTTTSVDGVESEGVTATTKTPGKPAIAFEELSLPFSVKDLITSGNGLLWIIGPFILLALAFLIVPKLRNLIIGAFRKDSKVSSEASERRTKAEAIQKMESQEAKESRTAREPKIERVEVAPKPIREPKELKQPRIREPKERTRTLKLSRERIREPRAPRASRETREPRERTRKPRDRRGIS